MCLTLLGNGESWEVYALEYLIIAMMSADSWLNLNLIYIKALLSQSKIRWSFALHTYQFSVTSKISSTSTSPFNSINFWCQRYLQWNYFFIRFTRFDGCMWYHSEIAPSLRSNKYNKLNFRSKFRFWSEKVESK